MSTWILSIRSLIAVRAFGFHGVDPCPEKMSYWSGLLRPGW